MKHMLVLLLAFLLLSNATASDFVKTPPIDATNGSMVCVATGGSRIEINGSSLLHNDTALKYALFGCVSVLVCGVALSYFPSHRIIVGGIQGNNISVTNGSQLRFGECNNVQLSNVKVTNGSSITIGNSTYMWSIKNPFYWPWKTSNTAGSNKKTTVNTQSSQIRQDISLYKQFNKWILAPKAISNNYFNNVEHRRPLFSFDTNPLPDTEASADRIAKEIIRFKFFCAQAHLNLFGYEKLLETYSGDEYIAAKNYKTWYKTSIFGFFYKKPDLDAFYKLQMQHRYVKYKQLIDQLGLQ